MSFDVFPDNSNRKTRLSELVNDVNIYFNDASQDVITIKERTETITNELHDMYTKLSLTPPPISEYAVSYILDDTGSQVALFIFKGITALVGLMGTQKALSIQLERAAVNYLVRTGEIGAAAFSRLAGLPLWLRAGRVLGSTGVAVIVTIGIELAIDAIAGSEIRDNLRRGINDEVPLRAKVYKTRKMNAYLREDLLAFITSLGIVKQLGYTEKQLEDIQTLHIAEITKRANEIYVNDQLILDGLSQLDNGRASWMHEDPSVELPISLIKDSIRNGEALLQDKSLETKSFRATMQSDGNFVVYDGNTPIWNSGTNGKGEGPYRLVLNSDGNLVLLDKNSTQLWQTGTSGRGSEPFQFLLHNNGSLVLWDKDLNVLWSTPASTIVHSQVSNRMKMAMVSESTRIEYTDKSIDGIFGENPNHHVNTSRRILQQVGYSLDKLNEIAM